jgi:CRISPR-associated protein Csd1
MILQALKGYYDRKIDDLPPLGWIEKEIDYAIVLNATGNVLLVDPFQESFGGKSAMVPNIGKQALKHTNSGVDANLLWDNSAFVLGVGKGGRKKRSSFVDILKLWLGDVSDDGIGAVISFYSTLVDCPETLTKLTDHPQHGVRLRSGNPIMAFRLAGEKGFIHERPAVSDAIRKKWGSLAENGGEGICLITGERDYVETCHPVTKGVRGTQTAGANIVGFNAAAFCSFNKDQGANAPAGKAAVFAYTTALNYLLRKDSPQKMLIGDATAVFWAEKPAGLETEIVDIFGEPPKDDPDRGVKAVESLYKSVQTGVLPSDEKQTKFYVLGLSPNAARISVRFWIVDTIAGMKGKIIQHFEDLRIVHGPNEKDTLSLFRLLVSTAVQGKSENISPNLAGETMRVILAGSPYPQTLLQAVIRRIRAEHEITYPRASLIKACINREIRFKNPQIKEELKVSLDTSNTNIGYRLGRLFATLEKIQAEANPGINATIRDRYFGAASGTPATVFPTLVNRLSQHHIAKLPRGRQIYFESLKQEIMNNIDGTIGFPSILSMADQGRFTIGYYQQTRDFFTRKESSKNGIQTVKEGEFKNE